MVVANYRILLLLALLSSLSAAQGDDASLMAGLEANSGLVLIISSVVIIILMVLMIFYLHSINEHLNWIRRIR
ncbi:MAG: hypothetical protein GF416_01955 [Candidatus Altiarchaeales archaeon]|nr:hypothetical protein [Candidatus Altiarchaeales archaeon]MBD3415881.1 hypothetical protein [Candidatus Altiarchaeales archaeon]